MTIREMQIFTEVARTCNMSAAAKNLYVSQSTVSQAILAMERQYDVQLFERQAKKLVLTPQGEGVLRYCSQILALHQSMEYELKANSRKSVRIGSTLITVQSLLTPIWRKYHLECPDVITHIAVETPELLILKLQNYELDVAILEEKPEHPDLVSQVIGEDDFLLICSPDSPLAGRKSVRLADLADQTLLLRKAGNPTRDLLDQAAAEQGLTLSVREYGNIDVIKDRTAAGEGVSVMARRLLEKEMDRGVLSGVPLADFPHKRYFYEVHHRRLHPSKYIDRFLCVCREAR